MVFSEACRDAYRAAFADDAASFFADITVVMFRLVKRISFWNTLIRGVVSKLGQVLIVVMRVLIIQDPSSFG